MEKSLVFGGRCTVLSVFYSPERLLWKTLQLSLFEGLEEYLDRYPKLGTMQNGVLYEQVISEPLIKEPGGSVSRIPPESLTKNGLLPTPQKIDAEQTPITRYNLSLNRKNGQKHQRCLNTVLGEYLKDNLLPTPLKNCTNNRMHHPSAWRRVEKTKMGSVLSIEVAKACKITQAEAIGNNFRLNPRFVEEMMGFPIGWTELEP